VWKYREYCRQECDPKGLVKVLCCVRWTEPAAVREIYRLLQDWPAMGPVDALQLLDAQFANRKVREYAVRCLDRLDDQELKDFLLQLVQALKYEPTHFSPLACWLLNRALHSQVLLGHEFFWLLQAELHVPEIAERYGLLLEMYLRGCGAQRDDLLRQLDLVLKLAKVSDAVKDVPLSRRKAEVQRLLRTLELPPTFQLPLDPT
jgi:hypothetical protein